MSERRRCALALLACALACHPGPPETIRLAFVGDSITHGCDPRGAEPDCVGYVDSIARSLPPDRFEVINAGVPGTSAWIWSETQVEGHEVGYDVWLAPHLPLDWVVVLLGANDAHSTLPLLSREPVAPGVYEERLRRLVRRLSADGVRRITLLAPLRQRRAAPDVAERLEAYRAIVARLCAEGPPLECGPRLDEMPASGFLPDGIHPNASGHAWLARRLLETWRTSGDVRLPPVPPVERDGP